MPLEITENEVHLITKGAFIGKIVIVIAIIAVPVIGLLENWIVGIAVGIPFLLFGIYKLLNPAKTILFTPSGIRVMNADGTESKLIEPSRIVDFSVSTVINKQSKQVLGYNFNIKLDKGKLGIWGNSYYSSIEENTAGKDAVGNYLMNVYGKSLKA